MLVLKMVNRHLAKLTREYTATQKGDLRALAIAEELSQVGAGGGEIQKEALRPTAKELAFRESHF